MTSQIMWSKSIENALKVCNLLLNCIFRIHILREKTVKRGEQWTDVLLLFCLACCGFQTDWCLVKVSNLILKNRDLQRCWLKSKIITPEFANKGSFPPFSLSYISLFIDLTWIVLSSFFIRKNTYLKNNISNFVFFCLVFLLYLALSVHCLKMEFLEACQNSKVSHYPLANITDFRIDLLSSLSAFHF